MVMLHQFDQIKTVDCIRSNRTDGLQSGGWRDPLHPGGSSSHRGGRGGGGRIGGGGGPQGGGQGPFQCKHSLEGGNCRFGNTCRCVCFTWLGWSISIMLLDSLDRSWGLVDALKPHAKPSSQSTHCNPRTNKHTRTNTNTQTQTQVRARGELPPQRRGPGRAQGRGAGAGRGRQLYLYLRCVCCAQRLLVGLNLVGCWTDLTNSMSNPKINNAGEDGIIKTYNWAPGTGITGCKQQTGATNGLPYYALHPTNPNPIHPHTYIKRKRTYRRGPRHVLHLLGALQGLLLLRLPAAPHPRCVCVHVSGVILCTVFNFFHHQDPAI